MADRLGTFVTATLERPTPGTSVRLAPTAPTTVRNARGTLHAVLKGICLAVVVLAGCGSLGEERCRRVRQPVDQGKAGARVVPLIAGGVRVQRGPREQSLDS